VQPHELIKKIRMIESYTSRLVNSELAGHYQSVFKGRGIVFSEVRPYAIGDDVRAIDWHVSARMNEPHVKVFTEERDRTVMLLIDMSASGLFASQVQRKRDLAAEIAAVVAFSAIKNNDRVGLLIVTDTVEVVMPAKKGKRHVLRVIREILTYAPLSRRTRLRAGLDYFARLARRKTVCFVLSDFIDSGWDKPLGILSRRHDIVPVVISDPLEEAVPDLGLVMLEDLETGDIVELDSSGPDGRRVAEALAVQRKYRDDALRRLHLDVIYARTDRPYMAALVAFFRNRARRMHHT